MVDQDLFDIAHVLQQRIDHLMSIGQINAILSMGDATLILPSPAVALAKLSSRQSVKLPSSTMLRTRDHMSGGEEVIFTPIDAGTEVHPWEVQQCRWTSVAPAGNQLATFGGMAVELVRAADSIAKSGWLRLWMNVGVCSSILLGSIRIYCEGHLLRVRRARNSADGIESIPPGVGPSKHIRSSLGSEIVECELPPWMCNRYSAVLEIVFVEPISTSLVPAKADGATNLCAVWNALDFDYPTALAAQERVARQDHKFVHPLVTSDLGRHWRPWLVKDVVALIPIGSVERRSDSVLVEHIDTSDLSVAVAPTAGSWENDGMTSGGRPESPLLALVINERLRRRIDAVGGRLRATAVATTGTLGNHVPKGCPLDLLDRIEPRTAEYVTGELFSVSWGGSDGLTQLRIEDWTPVRLRSIRRCAGRRTVDELFRIMDDYFAAWFALSHPEDLLRGAGPASAALTARAQFRRSDLSAHERRVILRAAERLANSYLGDNSFERIRLIEVDGDTGSNAGALGEDHVSVA